jgi:phosphate-selective porin OprO and OprP
MNVRSVWIRSLFLHAALVLTTSNAAASELEVSLTGRLHLDGAWHDEDRVPLSDGLLNRRSRLGARINWGDEWSGIIDYDFAENSTTAQDVFLSRKLGPGTLKIGQFKVPMGLNELTSSNNITFIERASNSNTVVDARRIGIGYDYCQGDIGFQTMVYTRAIGTTQAGDAPMGIGARFVYAPKVGADGLFHFGISAAYEDRQDDNTLRFRDRPEARPGGGVRLIDTSNIVDVDDTFKYGIELAYQAGPFSVEGEYLNVDVNRSAGAEPSFSGYHVQASYILTGEKRGYRGGVFRGVTPGQAGRGAWEIAARFSSIDLIDAGFQGGKQDNFTLGLNYYASANVRFMVNYIFIDVSDSTAVANGVVVGNDKPNVLLGRAMFYF